VHITAARPAALGGPLKGQTRENRKDYLVRQLFSDFFNGTRIYSIRIKCVLLCIFKDSRYRKMSGVNKDYYLTDNGLCEENGCTNGCPCSI
jgi:hypothetical protein